MFAALVVFLVNYVADPGSGGTLAGFAIGAAALAVGLAAGLPFIWREVRGNGRGSEAFTEHQLGVLRRIAGELAEQMHRCEGP